MKLALIRALKFLCYLLILFCIVYGVMLAVGMAEVRPEQLPDILSTGRGKLMVLAIVGLAALYPFYGVVSKKMRRVGSSEIIIAMEVHGFKLKRKEGKKMTFIPKKMMDRVRLRFDDLVEIDNNDEEITVIKGSRRAVYTILYKLGGEIL